MCLFVYLTCVERLRGLLPDFAEIFRRRSEGSPRLARECSHEGSSRSHMVLPSGFLRRGQGEHPRGSAHERREFEAKCRQPGLEGQIYREVARVRDEYGDEIKARYPAHWRRVSGYNLNELVPEVMAELDPVIARSKLTVTPRLSAEVPLVFSDPRAY